MTIMKTSTKDTFADDKCFKRRRISLDEMFTISKDLKNQYNRVQQEREAVIKTSCYNDSTIRIQKNILMKRLNSFTISIASLYYLICTIQLARFISGEIAPDVIAIKEGSDLDLSCPIVVPNEDMIISWTCDNEPADIRSSRIHVTNSGKLRIHSAKVGDSCNYRCEAADGFGTLSVIIKVIIVDKQFISLLSKQYNLAGSNNNNKSTTFDGAQGNRREDISNKAVGTTSVIDLDRNNNNFNEQQQQQQQSTLSSGDLEIQVEPSNVYVEKNETFSLECRVRHLSNMMVPQIIWLKEFIGRKPNSLNEALNQNLVLIDGNYYHSLNWPRSITYKRLTGSANSALLIRQSKYVHSGRYICFAGYPPTIMTSINFSFSNSPNIKQPPAGFSSDKVGYDEQFLNNQQQEQFNSPFTSTSTSTSTSSLTSTSTSTSTSRGLNYKMALAIVKVHDDEGERNYKLSLQTKKTSFFSSDSHSTLTNNMIDFWSENEETTPSSMKDTSIYEENNVWLFMNLSLLILFSCTLYLMKFLYIRYKSKATTVQSQTQAQATNTSNSQRVTEIV